MMRIRVEVGDAKADVDVGQTIEHGMNRLEELGRQAVNDIRKRVPSKGDVVARINSAIEERWGVRLVPAVSAAAAPTAPHRPARSASKRRPHQKKKRR
ncbi:MAG: hypothetical protein Q8R35_03730 [bacterium]|nr:hypothetical protein [bacterium]